MEEDILILLNSISSLEEREEVLLSYSLKSLEVDLRRALFAVSIPHWFDINTLKHLIGIKESESVKLINKLKELSYIEPFNSNGYAVHERTRKRLQKIFWRDNKNEYIAISLLAADYFSKIASSDINSLVEEIYHLLVAEPAKGIDLFLSTSWKWQTGRKEYYDRIELLCRMAEEQMDAGLLNYHACGWTTFWKAQTDFNYSRFTSAHELLASINKKWLRGNSFLRACIYKLQGDLFQKFNNFEEALLYYKKALPLYRKCNQQRHEARCFAAIGEGQRVIGEHDQAKKNFQKANLLYKVLGDRLGEANCLFLLGDENRLTGNYQVAYRKYEEAIEIYEKIGSLLGKANCLKAKGDLFFIQLLYPKARDQYFTSLDIYRAIRNPLGEANTLHRIGYIHESLDEYNLAQISYEEALEKYRQIKNIKGEARCLLSIGGLYNRKNMFKEAEDYFYKSLILCENVEDRKGQLFVYNNLNKLYRKHKDFNSAITILSDAIKKNPREVSLYVNRAYASIEIFDLESARADLLQALSINSQYPLAYLCQGELETILGNFAVAEEIFRKALLILPDTNAPYFSLGRIALLRGIFIEAIEWYQKGLKITLRKEDLDEEIEKLKKLPIKDQSIKTNISELITILENYLPF